MTDAKPRPRLTVYQPASPGSGSGRGVWNRSGPQGEPPLPTSRLPRSREPRDVFTALTQVLAGMDYPSLVALVQNDGPPYQIDSWRHPAAAAPWAELSRVLEAGRPMQRDDRVVAVRFQSAVEERTPPSFFVGALVARRRDGGRPSLDDVRVIGAMVDHAVAVVVAEEARADSAAQRARVEELEQAMSRSRDIGVAIGIIMASTHCSAEEAVEVLRSTGPDGSFSGRAARD